MHLRYDASKLRRVKSAAEFGRVAVLLGGIRASGGLLQRTAGLPDAAVSVLQGILFIVILASETLYGRRRGLRLRLPTLKTSPAKEAA